MTWLTYSNFITFIFAWAAFWLISFILLTIHLPDLGASDFEVMGFRGSIAFVCITVFLRRYFELSEAWLVPALSIFGWTAAATTIRVGITLCCHKEPPCRLIPRTFCSSRRQ